MRERSGGAGPLAVVSFTGNSGLTDYAVSFCREAALEREVCLLTATSIEEDYRHLGFPVETVFRRSRHYPIDVVRFLRRVVALRPVAVLFQGPLKFPLLDALAVRYLRARGLRVAVVVHDVVPHASGRWRRAALHRYYRTFPRLVTHSEEAVRRLRSFGVRGETVTVPHGRYDIFDVDRLTRGEARAALGIAAAPTVALFFGNLEERKGIAGFVEAAELPDGDDLMFVAAGQDFLSTRAPSRLRAMVRGETGAPRLRVDAGRVPHRDVQKYFRAADVVVLPYLKGSTSGVLKLALAFGVPVLATDVGDIRGEAAAGNVVLLPPRASGQDILDGIRKVHLDPPPRREDPRLEWRTIVPRVLSFLLDDC